MTADALYDTIGVGYAGKRRPDSRIAARITGALGEAGSVVNVGAGTGSYEPGGRRVVAVEPSETMIAQRPAGSAPVMRARAESLPFADGAFDAALAVLTVHHWTDRAAGLRELRRVARDRVVLYTHWWGPGEPSFWLVADYFPRIAEIDRVRFPKLDELSAVLGDVSVEPVPVPHDCTDGFLGAHWRYPEAYLDPGVRASMSGFAAIPAEAVETGVARLREDLRSGAWRRRHGHLLELDEIDLGYRLVVAAPGVNSS